MFERKRAAYSSRQAAQSEADEALSTIHADFPVVKALWDECCLLDRDSSGMLTPQEVRRALGVAQVAAATDALASKIVRGLEDNAGEWVGCLVGSHSELDRHQLSL